MSVHKGPNVIVVMNPAPLVYVQLFHPGSGPDRHLQSKTRDVARAAVVFAPKRTRHLARSIRAGQNRDERGRFTFGYEVSANARYAAAVHEGSRPSIRSKFPGVMMFQGTNGHLGRKGRGGHRSNIIYTEIVRHPGTPANPFLQKALIAMAS